jgi:hypothetical protein
MIREKAAIGATGPTHNAVDAKSTPKSLLARVFSR